MFLVSACTKGKQAEGAAKLETIRYATSAANLPITFGIKKGFFAEQGLDVKVITVTGGVEAVTAAAAGEAELGGMGSPILTGAAAGVPITIVASPPSAGQHFILVSRPGYQSLAQLKGKPISPGGAGQGTIQAFNVIARAKGFTPADFQNVNAGGTANALAALQAGKVEAIITSEITGVRAEQEGFGKVLERAADYFGHYQHSFIFATNKFIKEKPDKVRSFLVAYQRSVEYIKAHPEEAIQFGIKDLQQDEKSFRIVQSKDIPTWDTSGKVDLVGTDNAIKILKELGEIDPKVQITANRIVDQQYLPK
jgi:NitT/TauT family transport system substrate-binding protein